MTAMALVVLNAGSDGLVQEKVSAQSHYARGYAAGVAGKPAFYSRDLNAPPPPGWDEWLEGWHDARAFVAIVSGTSSRKTN